MNSSDRSPPSGPSPPSAQDGARPGEWICASEALAERGRGVRFTVERAGWTRPAFAFRWNGTVHAYLNECAHRSVELDWIEGEFLDRTGDALVCATHGARYHPPTGACLDGPCGRAALIKLAVREAGGEIRLAQESLTKRD